METKSLQVLACVLSLSVATCGDSDVEISPESRFVAWKHSSTGLAWNQSIYSDSTGTHVFRMLPRKGSQEYDYRLIRLDENGSLVFEKSLTFKSKTVRLIPLGFNGGRNTFAFVRISIPLSKADQVPWKYWVSIVEVDRQSGSVRETKPQAFKHKGVTLGGGRRATDGRVLLYGKARYALWLGMLAPDGRPLWGTSFYDEPTVGYLLSKTNPHVRFGNDGTVSFVSSSPKARAGKFIRNLYRLTIKSDGSAVGVSSLLDYKLEDIKPSGPRAAPGAYLLRRANDGFVFNLDGWHGNRFVRARVARTGKAKKLSWITTLIDSKKGDVVGLAVGSRGEIVAIGKDDGRDSIYVMSPDGKVRKRYSAGKYSILSLRAHANGGYILRVRLKNKKKANADAYLRIKSWMEK